MVSEVYPGGPAGDAPHAATVGGLATVAQGTHAELGDRPGEVHDGQKLRPTPRNSPYHMEATYPEEVYRKDTVGRKQCPARLLGLAVWQPV